MSAQMQHNILYSCEECRKRGHEQLVTEHALGIILSGETHFQTNEGTKVFGAGMIGLLRKNQLAKTLKVPAADGTPFRSVNIFLDQQTLKRYAAAHHIHVPDKYHGNTMIALSDDLFIKSYFQSLLPYFDHPAQLTPDLAVLKTEEAIALLMRPGMQLKEFLFDFSEPYKIDLEAFMAQNYMYNIPLSQFARLTGRSLSTFKRDFHRTFDLPPEKWLLTQRLQQAHFLIKEQQQKPGSVYINVGFENLSHFSTAFKQHYGYTPSSLNT